MMYTEHKCMITGGNVQEAAYRCLGCFRPSGLGSGPRQGLKVKSNESFSLFYFQLPWLDFSPSRTPWQCGLRPKQPLIPNMH